MDCATASRCSIKSLLRAFNASQVLENIVALGSESESSSPPPVTNNTVITNKTMKSPKMVFEPFRKLWEARGHQITELKYMATPIHWHLFPLIAQHGESFLGKKSAVFEATLIMKPYLGSVDGLEWDSIIQCDDSEQSTDDEDCIPRSPLASSQLVATEGEDTTHSASTAEVEGAVYCVHKGVDDVQASQPQPLNPGIRLNMPHTGTEPDTQKSHENEASGGHSPRRKRSADDTEDEEESKVWRPRRKLIWDSDGSI